MKYLHKIYLDDTATFLLFLKTLQESIFDFYWQMDVNFIGAIHRWWKNNGEAKRSQVKKYALRNFIFQIIGKSMKYTKHC